MDDTPQRCSRKFHRQSEQWYNVKLLENCHILVKWETNATHFKMAIIWAPSTTVESWFITSNKKWLLMCVEKLTGLLQWAGEKSWVKVNYAPLDLWGLPTQFMQKPKRHPQINRDYGIMQRQCIAKIVWAQQSCLFWVKLGNIQHCVNIND